MRDQKIPREIQEENRRLIETKKRMEGYTTTSWYTDEDINALLRLLPEKKVYISNSLVYSSEIAQSVIEEMLRDSYLEADGRPMVIPINLVSSQRNSAIKQDYEFSGMHWTVAVIYPQTELTSARAIIADPFGNGFGKEKNLSCKDYSYKSNKASTLIKVAKSLKSSLQSFGVVINDSEVCILGDKIQKNSHDCGPIIVELAERIINKSPKLCSKEVSGLRKKQLGAIHKALAENNEKLEVAAVFQSSRGGPGFFDTPAYINCEGSNKRSSQNFSEEGRMNTTKHTWV